MKKTTRWVKLRNTRTGGIHTFTSTSEAARFLDQPGRLKITRTKFFNFNTGRWFDNITSPTAIKEHSIHARS